MLTSLAITPEEHRARCDGLLAATEREGVSGIVLFDPYYILYYAGFAFVPTERPITFVLAADGTRALVVPRLEVEHAEAKSTLDRVEHYLEYPGDPRPETVLAQTLADLGVAGTIGADQDGYPWILGHRGPTLSELSGATVIRIAEGIEAQMAVKSAAEVALVRESVRWGNLAQRLLQRYTRVGATETEVSQRASNEATFAMLDAIGEIYRAQSFVEAGANAGYRGQIGRNSAIPHSLAGNIVFQAGDVLVTGASAPVWGYLSELERTMVLGEPTADQARMFEHMLALQDLALDAIRPGRSCADVDRRRPRVLRGARPVAVLAPPHRARHRTALPRGAVPRLGRRHGDPSRHGLHRRAGPLLARARRLPALRHRARHGVGQRDPDVLPARPREPRHSGVTAWGPSPST